MQRAGPQALVLLGSLRRPSFTAGLCEAVSTRMRFRGFSVTLFDPRETPIPWANPAFHKDPSAHPDPIVKQLVLLAERAEALVLATPIYHNGPSAVLKNLLDSMAIAQLAYKPIGLMSHGGNRTTQAVEQMRLWTRGLLGYAIAVQVCTAKEDFGSVSDLQDPKVESEAILGRVDRFIAELEVMTHVMKVARHALR